MKKTKGFLLAVAVVTMGFIFSCSSDEPVEAYSLICGILPSSGYANSPITSPVLTCDNEETPTDITWLGSPAIDWNNPKGGTYSNIGVMANCGTKTDLIASCSGTLTVLHLLSCSIPSIGYEGEAIKPVLSCSDGSVPFDIAFSGYFPNWDNPAAGNYATLAEANCGQGALPKISCGTLTVKAARFTFFTDTRNNKTYKAVAIGTQTWMAENLNYYTSDSKCYNNDPANCEIYGRLYNWSTARTVCPTGWHLPSQAEWEVMTSFIGGENTEGKRLKATSGWAENGNGTDDYGFSALPGGICNTDGSFSLGDDNGEWWSASEYNDDNAYRRLMEYNHDDANWGYYNKNNWYSIRCLKD